MKENPRSEYAVFVDDNFHPHDEDGRFELGRFVRLADAINECAALTLESLLHLYRPGMDAQALYDNYIAGGDDPFVRGPGITTEPPFSAWRFAKRVAPLVVQMKSNAAK